MTRKGPIRERGISDGRVMTPANVTTFARLGLSLGAGALFLEGDADRFAVWLCAVSVALDAADGWIARRWRHESVLGALLDPVADKVTIVVVFGTIALRAASPVVWSLFALGVVRDAAVTVQRIAVAEGGRRLVEPDAAGKFKTAVQDGAGLGILFYAVYGGSPRAYSSALAISLLAAAVVLSYVSWVRYAAVFQRRSAAGNVRESGTERRCAE